MNNTTQDTAPKRNGNRESKFAFVKSPDPVVLHGPGEKDSPADPEDAMDLARARRQVWFIVAVYVLVSAAWILCSHRFLAVIVLDPETRVQWSIYEGWFFVSATGLLLFLLISRLILKIATDTSRRRRDEEKAREKESLFRAVVDNLPFEFWVRDRDERCIVENTLAVKHWGSNLGKGPEDNAVSQEELEGWKEINRRAYSGEVVEWEDAVVIAGQKRLFKKICAPIRAEHGIRGILGFNIDVTEQRLAEKLIRESEAKYRNYIDGSPVAILVFDLTGRCVEVNPAACVLSGKSAAELMRMNARDMLSPVSTECADWHFDVFRKAGRVSLDLEYRREDGVDIYLTLNAIKLSENRYIAFCQDITSRKTAHNALQASEQQYRTTIDSMNEGIYMVDERLRVLLLNNTIIRWCEEFGLPKVSQGQHLKEAFQFLPESVYKEYQKVFETGTVVRSTERISYGGKELDTETIKIP
ncbi:MAG: PAS domain S-box protein, partial [Verrucomicrobiota bacterium]